MKLRPPLAAVGLVVAGLLTLSACSAAQFPTEGAQPQRDETSGQVTEGQEDVDVFSIRVGDCINSAAVIEESQLQSIPVVPCSEEHEDEVYHAFDSSVSGEEYPGEDVLLDEADTVCAGDAFTEFIGVPFTESVLDYWPMYPSDGSWASGDREILCMVYEGANLLTGSLAGAAR
ncbi:septum formation family protein [Microbacterium sp. Sa4CUA7]|uniref:Septum formation family protein n=1 Tax=Microbacterium pullorum TaxID=2762236 RepID=A0ABR8S5M7_9MICO|nr:septum formation family protein [Microbacterium pullorum]MBD7958760.1 septum formation family protein [Microbacterium pullorum]